VKWACEYDCETHFNVIIFVVFIFDVLRLEYKKNLLKLIIVRQRLTSTRLITFIVSHNI
jgi:hypothetical protein